MVERARRLRVRPRQPGLRGPRETRPGPIMWVRPATGWWGRMNAGESPRNQGRRRGAPVRLQKAVLRSKEKRRSGAPRGERPSQWACAARRIDVTRAFRRSAPLTFCEGALPLVSEGMEMPGAPRALREQGRRSFGSFIHRLLEM